MSYLARLKHKISQDVPKQEATKVSKGAFVPFVAPPPAPLRGIYLADDVVGDDWPLADDRIKCRDCANWQRKLTQSPYEWRASIKHICTADDLHYEPMPDMLKRCGNYQAKLSGYKEMN